MRRIMLVVVAAMLLALAGCSEGSSSNEAGGKKPAPPAPGGNAPAPAALSQQGGSLILAKSALGQEFLMMPTLVMYSEPISTPEAMASKVVSFHRDGPVLTLLESTEGKTVTDPYDPQKIVAQFPVLAESGEAIAFDFRAGFQHLVLSDGDGSGSDRPESALPISSSYLDRFVAEPKLFAFNHVAQTLVSAGYRGLTPVTVTFNYAFVPSEEDMVPLDPNAFGDYGFFASGPSYERTTGKMRYAVNRWDIAKPITFLVSANTPPAYVEAVRAGILAWNAAFGREVLKAEVAPEETVAGDAGVNIVQWVGYDDAGFAYASWHAHPRTGEIQDAFVVLTSVFAAGSRARAAELLDMLDRRSEGKLPGRARIGLPGFSPSAALDQELGRSCRQFLELATSGALKDEEILRLSQLYVKAITMHEIGHDLGLRHNFAGNLGSEIPLESDRKDFFEVVGGKAPEGKLPSSSIMDYLAFQDDIRMHRPGRHDEMALEWAYGLDGAEGKPPLFCTDEDVGRPLDCALFDGGADPVQWRREKVAAMVEEASHWLARRFLEGRRHGTNWKAIGAMWEMIVTHLEAADYLNMGNDVLDLPNRSASARRTDAAAIVARAIEASDESNDALKRLVTEELAGKLWAPGADPKAAEEVRSLLVEARTFLVGALLRQLAWIFHVQEFGGFGVMEHDGGLERAPPPSVSPPDEVAAAVAPALASVATNYVAALEPAEQAEFRMMASGIVGSFREGRAASARTSAIQKTEGTIRRLTELLEREADGAQRERISALLVEEESLLAILSGKDDGGGAPPPAIPTTAPAEQTS